MSRLLTNMVGWTVVSILVCRILLIRRKGRRLYDDRSLCVMIVVARITSRALVIGRMVISSKLVSILDVGLAVRRKCKWRG